MSDEPKPADIVNGVPWWDFMFEYEFEGGISVFTVRARSRTEAVARLGRIGMGRYIGQSNGPWRLIPSNTRGTNNE